MTSLKKWIPYLPVALLAYYSLEILFRRWVLGQDPAQVASGFTYLLILVNVGYCLYFINARLNPDRFH